MFFKSVHLTTGVKKLNNLEGKFVRYYMESIVCGTYKAQQTHITDWWREVTQLLIVSDYFLAQ